MQEMTTITQYPGETTSQILMYLLGKAKDNIGIECYHIAATYLEDAEIVKYELDRMAVTMIE